MRELYFNKFVGENKEQFTGCRGSSSNFFFFFKKKQTKILKEVKLKIKTVISTQGDLTNKTFMLSLYI